MPFEHLNRHERRAAQAYAKAEAEKRPATLTEIPREQWGAAFRSSRAAPVKAWHSNRFLAQLYEAPAMSLPPTTVMRLSVCRVTLKQDGRWEEGLTWEELMRVKREVGYGDWYAVEIYPRDRDIVNVANMRHLWLLAQPLGLGWFSDNGKGDDL